MAKKKSKLTWQGQLVLTSLVIAGVFFSHTTILLLAGMIPTIVAAYTDRSREHMRAITIGAMNLAGCTPFIVKLWLTEPSIETALHILSEPFTWMVMYAAAGIGYCLEWVIVGAAGVYMAEKASNRIRSIEKQQQKLVTRWGDKVTGKIQLDETGFPLKAIESKTTD